MLPELFVQRMQKLLSEDEFSDFIKSFGDAYDRYHALRINTLKNCDIDSLVKNESGSFSYLEGIGKRVPWEENGFYYDDSMAPGKHPYHEAGLYYIQEPSAMAPVHYLNPSPGEKILDLCAAPGGKSTQIAVKMKGQGILISNEIVRDRAKILSLNVERLGITNCMVLNETPEHLAERFEGYFDKILVDAPCSGEGMFRKNEIATSEWSPENVANCAQRQIKILECASKMLAPGGILVYSTCTFSPDENEESMFRFLACNSDFHALEVPLIDGMENARPEFISNECIEEICTLLQSGEERSEDTSEDVLPAKIDELKSEVKHAIRLWPHKLNGEGHFLCVLKRGGYDLDSSLSDSTEGHREMISKRDNYVPGGRKLPAKKDIIRPFEDFAKETFAFSAGADNTLKSGLDLGQTIFSFGDQLYLAPSDMPSTNNLKVMRPGLHLGTVKKDRFEPSHALALAIKPEDVLCTVNFSADSQEIRQYLNGQTIRLSDNNSQKGWTLITVDGFSIGWAKLSAGMLKNHYPKGLRINY